MSDAVPPVPSLAIFAPVKRFVLDPIAIQAGTVSGYAVSQRHADFAGRRGRVIAGGCAVKLVSGTGLFGITRAWAFSEQAHDDGVQDGWAGFAIHGLPTAMALGPIVELRCVVSDTVLATLGRSDLPVEMTPLRHRHLDVRALRSTLRSVYGCSDLLHMLPIAERYRDVAGDGAFVDASYRWLLRRHGSRSEMHGFISDFQPGWLILDMWGRMTASDEFRAGTGFPVLGPFEAGFPFHA